jgi:hypothetical protein
MPCYQQRHDSCFGVYQPPCTLTCMRSQDHPESALAHLVMEFAPLLKEGICRMQGRSVWEINFFPLALPTHLSFPPPTYYWTCSAVCCCIPMRGCLNPHHSRRFSSSCQRTRRFLRLKIPARKKMSAIIRRWHSSFLLSSLFFPTQTRRLRDHKSTLTSVSVHTRDNPEPTSLRCCPITG